MRAAFIRRYGGPEVLEVGEMPEPTCGDDDVVVETAAVSLNPVDAKLRAGQLKAVTPLRMPAIMGNDLAGRVVRIGKNVTRFAVGDEVYARVDKRRIGTLADRVAVYAKDCAKKPASLSLVEAAAVPLVGLTAWQALLDLGGLDAGKSMLMHAGSGGVGTMALQIGRARGARVVTTASARNTERLMALGADRVIDYKTEKFWECGERFDVVFDTQGGDTLVRSFDVVKPGGLVVSVGAPVPDVTTARELGLAWPMRAIFWLLNRRWRALAKKANARYRYLFMHADGDELATLGQLADAGELKPVLDEVFPFERLKEAFARVESGRAFGKVVVTFA